MKASALVVAVSRLGPWCDRRRAAGLFPAMVRAELLRLRLRSRTEEEGREARATERVERPGGAGRRPDQVKAVGRGASNAGVRPPRGRRRVERGGRRAREREGRGSGPRCLAGPKGRRVGPAAPVPFPFFLNFFSQILSKFIWTI